MIEKRDVLRRLRAGHGLRQIHRDLGIHRTLIRELREFADRHGWLDPDKELPSEVSIAASLREAQNKQTPHVLDDWQERMLRWHREDKLSFQSVHRKLHDEGLEVSEPTVRRYLHRLLKPALPSSTMVRVHEPGEAMEVDFCFLGVVWDPAAGRNRKCWGFSARLRASRHAWRERVWDQRAETFFQCHVRAFEHFGGVPRRVVCDNLKAAVIQASIEDPVVNRGYQMLAEHYGFLIDPCRPYTPKHKGGVESDMKYMENNFYRSFVVDQRELGHDIPDGEVLQKALEHWSLTTAYERTIKEVGHTVRELFGAERTHLQRLPAVRWSPVAIGKALVRDTGRVQFRGCFYSVPWQKIDKDVQIIATGDQVIILLEGEEIARHSRAFEKGAVVANALHNPPQVEAWLDLTKERVRQVAGQVGEATSTVACRILDRERVDGLRPAKALIGLRRRFGENALEAACRYALTYECAEYTPIKHFLERGNTVAMPPASQIRQSFAFARSSEDYEQKLGGTR